MGPIKVDLATPEVIAKTEAEAAAKAPQVAQSAAARIKQYVEEGRLFQSDEAVSTLAAKEADDDSKSAAEAALTLEAEQAAAEALEATQPAKISGERAKEHAGNLFESKVSLSALAAATIAEAATTEAEKQYELEKIETAKRLAEEERLAELQRIAEEERRMEAARIAEAKRLMEEQRIAEENRRAELERIQMAERLAEAKRIEEERKRVEAEKLAKYKRIEEAKHTAYEEAIATEASSIAGNDPPAFYGGRKNVQIQQIQKFLIENIPYMTIKNLLNDNIPYVQMDLTAREVSKLKGNIFIRKDNT